MYVTKNPLDETSVWERVPNVLKDDLQFEMPGVQQKTNNAKYNQVEKVIVIP